MAEVHGCGWPRVAAPPSCPPGEPVRHDGDHSRARRRTGPRPRPVSS
ncbi:MULTISPECIES: hypothetical protein [unclassified Nonomuraea]